MGLVRFVESLTTRSSMGVRSLIVTPFGASALRASLMQLTPLTLSQALTPKSVKTTDWPTLKNGQDLQPGIPVQLVDCKLNIKTLITFFYGGSNINIVRRGLVKEEGWIGVKLTWI